MLNVALNAVLKARAGRKEQKHNRRLQHMLVIKWVSKQHKKMPSFWVLIHINTLTLTHAQILCASVENNNWRHPSFYSTISSNHFLNN